MSWPQFLDFFGQLPLFDEYESENIRNTSNSRHNIITPKNIKPKTSVSESKIAQFKEKWLNCVPTLDGNPIDLNIYLTICEIVCINISRKSARSNYFESAVSFREQVVAFDNELIDNLQNI